MNKENHIQEGPLCIEDTTSKGLEDCSNNKERLKSIIVMDSKDKSKIDERGKTHKRHKGKKKKEEDKANTDTRRKGLGNNMQQQ